MTLEHQRRNSDTPAHFIFVIDAVEEFVIAWLINQIDFTPVTQSCYLPTVNIGHLDARVLKKFFNQHQYIGNLAPFL